MKATYLILFLSVVVLFSCNKAEPPQGSNSCFHVTDALTGEPVVGALVDVIIFNASTWDPPGGYTTSSGHTNSNGDWCQALTNKQSLHELKVFGNADFVDFWTTSNFPTNIELIPQGYLKLRMIDNPSISSTNQVQLSFPSASFAGGSWNYSGNNNDTTLILAVNPQGNWVSISTYNNGTLFSSVVQENLTFISRDTTYVEMEY